MNLTRLSRLIVRLALLGQPAEFRRQFGADILRDVDADLREAATLGRRALLRTSVTTVLDAIRALRRRSDVLARTTPQFVEKPRMRNWIRDAIHDVRLGVRGFRR